MKHVRHLLSFVLLAGVCISCFPESALGQSELTVDAILAKWQEREKQLRSASFEWVETRTQPKGDYSRNLHPNRSYAVERRIQG
jgi:hypothetical protein